MQKKKPPKIPLPCLAQEALRLIVVLFEVGEIVSHGFLKAILLASLTPSCVCARRRRSRKEMKFAKPPERLQAGEGRRRGGSVALPSSSMGLVGSRGGVSIPAPLHPPAAGPLKPGASAAAHRFPAAPGCTGSNKVPPRDAGDQGFLLLQHHPGGDHPKSFYPATAAASRPSPPLFNRERFQEQEVSLCQTQTSSQLGTQIFS